MTKKTILIIDDDADFTRVLGQRCESIGLEVLRTHNLLSATMIVAKSAPDIVCVDVQMPTGSGLAFCESLAADPTTATVPIVVLTGNGSLETQQACTRLHAYLVEKSGNCWRELEPLLRELAAQSSTSEEPSRRSPQNRLPSDRPVSPPPRALVVGADSARGTKQIVVADDDRDILSMLSQRLSSLGCSVFGADNALDAMNAIHRIVPDLVCLDVGMPSGSGLSICEMMASSEQLRSIPIIILTGRSDESTIRRCHDMLVYYVQKSAETWHRVEPLVRELLQLEESAIAPHLPPQASIPVMAVPPVETKNKQFELADAVFAVLGAAPKEQAESHDDTLGASESDVPWVLSIDDDADFSDALRMRLEQHGVAVLRAFSGMEGYRLAFTSPASAILLDYNMPNGQGDYILGRLKDNPVTAEIPVIIITGVRDKVLERRMLAMGAAAYLEKPINFDLLREELSKHIDILNSHEEPSSAEQSRKATTLRFHPISS